MTHLRLDDAREDEPESRNTEENKMDDDDDLKKYNLDTYDDEDDNQNEEDATGTFLGALD